MSEVVPAHLRQKLLHQIQFHFASSFPQHDNHREAILNTLRELVERPDLKHLWQPTRRLSAAHLEDEASRIKNRQIDRAQLEEYGVYTSYAALKSNEDSLDLYAGLYLLPVPLEEAQARTYHPEDYKKIRPYVTRSAHCILPGRSPGYYLETGAFGVYGGMVVRAEYDPPSNGTGVAVAHFHLAEQCQGESGENFQTQGVRALDGMKIYLGVGDKTLVLSATLSVLSGWKGSALRLVASDETNRQGYGLTNLSEIWSTIYYRSANDRSQTDNPTGVK